jgi:adenylate kinase
MTKIILLMGAPGSGKGTQGALISKALSIPHLSTGDILRMMAKEDSVEARELNKFMSEGKMIPSDVMNVVLKNCLQKEEYKDGYILDGYPRTLEQLQYFQDNISREFVVLFFDLDEEIAIKRITGRFSCAGCGKLYNKFYFQPKEDGRCDVCGHTKFSFINRLKEFQVNTKPVINQLNNKKNFFIIEAAKSMGDIIYQVNNIIKKI